MSRPHRSLSLMQTANVWASRSTCSRLHVGCVLEREGRILVQGYNGAPAGLDHCDHSCDCFQQRVGVSLEDTHELDCNRRKPCTRSVHAEQNAIAFAARWGVELKGSSLWVTHQPCLPCAQLIINAGVEEVYFVEPYRLQEGIELLDEAGVDVYDLGRLHGLSYGKVDA